MPLLTLVFSIFLFCHSQHVDFVGLLGWLPEGAGMAVPFYTLQRQHCPETMKGDTLVSYVRF